MSTYLTYKVEICEKNAALIDAMNTIMLPGYGGTSSSTGKAGKANTDDSGDDGLTLDDIKTFAKKCKKDHGEEFAMAVLKKAGVDVKASLGRSMSAIDEDDYATIVEAWKAGPQDDDDEGDLDDDDDLDEEEEEAEVDADAVKTALKAYSKEHGRDKAKKIMAKFDLTKLADVDDMDDDDMAKLLKKVL